MSCLARGRIVIRHQTVYGQQWLFPLGSGVGMCALCWPAVAAHEGDTCLWMPGVAREVMWVPILDHSEWMAARFEWCGPSLARAHLGEWSNAGAKHRYWSNGIADIGRASTGCSNFCPAWRAPHQRKEGKQTYPCVLSGRLGIHTCSAPEATTKWGASAPIRSSAGRHRVFRCQL